MDKRVQSDPLLIQCGELFMFLLWIESMMCDLLALRHGDEHLRIQYNLAFGHGPHPSAFVKKRSELQRQRFGIIKETFMCAWPIWKDSRHVHESIERTSILRNLIAHSHIQPFRKYLLCNPENWVRVNQWFKCSECLKYMVKCTCLKPDLADPPLLVLDSELIDSAYEDIKVVDREYLYPVAQQMKVRYIGVAWWQESAQQFVIAKN